MSREEPKMEIIVANHHDWDATPQWVKDRFARATLHAIERFYKDPKNQKEFEEWLPKYRAEQAAKAEAKARDEAEAQASARGVPVCT